MHLAICAIFKDEARYLREWVTFHRMMGVERFLLYDNASTDDWRTTLSRELSEGTVSVTHWPRPRRDAQVTAYRHCIAKRSHEAKWIAFIDVDEFLFSPTTSTLPDVLRRFHAQSGVAVGWRTYGTAGLAIPPPAPVIEAYVQRARDDHFLNAYAKVIVRPHLTVAYLTHPHLFTHYHPSRLWRMTTSVDERSRPYLGGLLSVELLRINHYYSKSETEARAKWGRGSVTHTTEPPLNQLLDPSLNEVEDPILTSYAPELRRQLDSSASIAAEPA